MDRGRVIAEPNQATRSPRAWPTALAVTSLVVLGCTPEPSPPEPEPTAIARPAPACPRSAPEDASSCRRCHSEIHDEWRGSGHAAAFDDPVFRSEHDLAPSSFCRDCHAAGQARHGHPPHDGVDCASCHASAAGSRGWRTCAPCHQFEFPATALGHGLYDPADPLQDTIREWSRSEAAAEGRDCLDCHMPWTGEGATRHRSHHMTGAGDPALVASAVVASASARAEPDGLEVTVTLAPGDVGHRVPTGDMFRQLRVAAWSEGGAPVERWLGRIFAHMPASDDHGFRLRPVLDDRVPAPGDGDPLQIRLLVPGAGILQARWSVELHRMPPEQARARGLPAEALRVPVAYGTVTADPG